MDVKNCIRCGRMFRPIGGVRICPDCVKQERDQFERVRDYIRKHPKANMIEVSQATEVTTRKILEYVREGKLVVSAGSDWGLKCESCGEPIATGRLCPRCAGEMEAELKGKPRIGAFTDERPDQGGGRVIRDKFRRRVERR